MRRRSIYASPLYTRTGENIFLVYMQTLIFSCPQCGDLIIVDQKDLNCCIFRHAVDKKTFQPINPHASERECQSLVDTQQIYGCGKPFQAPSNI